MKQLRPLFIAVLATMLPTTVSADVWQDPETGVVYEYYTDEDTATVAKGTRYESDIMPQVVKYGNTIAQEVVIPETITIDGKSYTVSSIGEYAFCYLDLEQITIPRTVEWIGRLAFASCSRLSNVLCYANPKHLLWDYKDFMGYTNFKPDRATWFHVIGGYLDAYTSKFGDMNVTFKGDLEGEVEDEYEAVASKFTGYSPIDSYSGMFVTDTGRNWSASFSTAPDYIGFASLVSGMCICIEYYSDGLYNFTLTNNFPVTGKVKKVKVNVAGNPVAITCRIQERSGGPMQYAEVGCTQGDEFLDYAMEFDATTEYVDGEVTLGFITMNPIFIHSVTIVSSGGETIELPSGMCGPNLQYALEYLPYKITDYQTQAEVQAMRLLITGTGDMYDYQIVPGSTDATTTAPWAKYKDFITEVLIPDEVTYIGDWAFDRFWGNSFGALPTSLKSVGTGAFFNCIFQGELRLPDGMTTVGSSSFNSILGAQDVYVPKSLTWIGSGGLAEIMGVQNFHVDANNPAFTGEGNCIIRKDNATLISGGKNTVIPDWVTSIGSEAFGDQDIEIIRLPEGLTSIQYHAFYYSGLCEVTIPDNVQTIGQGAFSRCGHLTKVTIGSGVTNIEADVFNYSQNILDVFCTADPEALQWTRSSLDAYAFMLGGDTKFHVRAEDLTTWQSKFSFLNVTFVGDLGTDLAPILEETTVDLTGLVTADLTDNTVNNVYYNLSEATGSGYTDGCLVIGKTTDMGSISDTAPGSADIRDRFTGIIIKVGPGRGTVSINACNLGYNTRLAVRIGDGTPVYAACDARRDVLVAYDVDVETFIYIYAVPAGSLVKPFASRAPGLTDDSILIYGISVYPNETPDAIHEVEAVQQTAPAQRTDIYNLVGQRLNNSQLKRGIYIVGGRKVMK